MFRKLRNKLIFINLGITSLVVVIVFTVIYISSTRIADNRPPMPSDNRLEFEFSQDVEDFVEMSITVERQTAARDLLITLIISGVAIEIMVAFISYFLAEEAIKPVREAYEAQKVFIANASHEIKTPLAAIAANLEAADIKNNRWISNVEKETAKLTALNGELLTLARTDLVNTVNLEEVDLGAVLNREIKTFEPRSNGIDFEKDIPNSEKIKINVADLVQVFNILLDNAIKYCDKKISVNLAGGELVVKNDGTVISEKDLAHIFDRFYQADKSAEGVGLGLSIAKTLADRNGWKISVKSSDSETEFVVKF
jgi:signal transduction histidine kinase